MIEIIYKHQIKENNVTTAKRYLKKRRNKMKTSLVILMLIASFSVQAAEGFIEPLFGLYMTSDTVSIQVASGGCTNKKSFRIKKYFNHRNNVYQLLFVRIAPDYCEAYFPEGSIVNFTHEDLNLESGQRFQIMNPLSVNRVPESCDY